MTFEQFQQLPDPKGSRYELHRGELVKVVYPEYPHLRAQWQVRRALENAAGDAGAVIEEMPFRPLPDEEGWFADVAFVSKARWETIDRYLMGAPELVIEVVSPSNTAAELLEKEQICLENGAREFWAADTPAHGTSLDCQRPRYL